MKVYVDENDLDVIEDLFQATNSYECWACNRDDDLEIISLSDYTKQVRREVVQELKEKLKAKEIFQPEDEFTLDYDFYYKEDVEEILDQIEQGETNVKN